MFIFSNTHQPIRCEYLDGIHFGRLDTLLSPKECYRVNSINSQKWWTLFKQSNCHHKIILLIMKLEWILLWINDYILLCVVLLLYSKVFNSSNEENIWLKPLLNVRNVYCVLVLKMRTNPKNCVNIAFVSTSLYPHIMLIIQLFLSNLKHFLCINLERKLLAIKHKWTRQISTHTHNITHITHPNIYTPTWHSQTHTNLNVYTH